MTRAQRTGGHYRAFHYLGFAIGVSATCESDLAWLEQFLTPAFRTDGGTEVDAEVELTIDHRRYDEARSRGPDPSRRELVCFALESREVVLPRWRAHDHEEMIFEEEFGVFYLVSTGGGPIRILAPTSSHGARCALMRVVRELATIYCHRHASLLVHGAAFLTESNGVVLAGPKRAGKSSLLLHSLREKKRVRYVSNDRVLLTVEGPQPRLHGMPTFISIRPGTIDRLPGFQKGIDLLVNASKRDNRGEPRRRYSLTPSQFRDLTGVAPVPSGTLTTLVFPQVVNDTAGIELQRLSPKVATQKLFESLFRAESAQKVADTFWADREHGLPDGPRQMKQCAELVSRVQAFECRLGPRAYEGTAFADLIDDGLA